MRSLHVARSGPAPTELAAQARAAGAERIRIWQAVEGPPVPAEFRSVDGRPRIHGLVSVWHPEEHVHRVLTGEGEGYLVEESLIFERDPASGLAPDRLTRIGTQTRAPGLTRPEFARHWRDVHARLVEAHQPGIVRYVQNVVVDQLYGTSYGVDGFHESTFADLAAYRDRLFDDEVGRTRLREDTAVLLADATREERIFAVPIDDPEGV